MSRPSRAASEDPMSYLKTKTLTVGDQRFILSEFTALDRLRDLQYATQYPTLEKPAADASDAEKLEYGIKMETLTLDQVSHSIALSLAHTCQQMEDGRVDALQAMVKDQWPNRSVNEAYEALKALNMPEQVEQGDEQSDESSEAMTLEK